MASADPTAEAGLTGFDFLVWHGLYAPKGTPKDIVGKLNASINAGMGSSQMQQQVTYQRAIEGELARTIGQPSRSP